ncbi:hypothetical protein ScalyP_jg9521 [Parmales sp. scaly parma]|nr:hypothetical protein ScalyP_jg9521 [Parmales sp. scaly parma]
MESELFPPLMEKEKGTVGNRGRENSAWNNKPNWTKATDCNAPRGGSGKGAKGKSTVEKAEAKTLNSASTSSKEKRGKSQEDEDVQRAQLMDTTRKVKICKSKGKCKTKEWDEPKNHKGKGKESSKAREEQIEVSASEAAGHNQQNRHVTKRKADVGKEEVKEKELTARMAVKKVEDVIKEAMKRAAAKSVKAKKEEKAVAKKEGEVAKVTEKAAEKEKAKVEKKAEEAEGAEAEAGSGEMMKKVKKEKQKKKISKQEAQMKWDKGHAERKAYKAAPAKNEAKKAAMKAEKVAEAEKDAAEKAKKVKKKEAEEEKKMKEKDVQVFRLFISFFIFLCNHSNAISFFLRHTIIFGAGALRIGCSTEARREGVEPGRKKEANRKEGKQSKKREARAIAKKREEKGEQGQGRKQQEREGENKGSTKTKSCYFQFLHYLFLLMDMFGQMVTDPTKLIRKSAKEASGWWNLRAENRKGKDGKVKQVKEGGKKKVRIVVVNLREDLDELEEREKEREKEEKEREKKEKSRAKNEQRQKEKNWDRSMQRRLENTYRQKRWAVQDAGTSHNDKDERKNLEDRVFPMPLREKFWEFGGGDGKKEKRHKKVWKRMRKEHLGRRIDDIYVRKSRSQESSGRMQKMQKRADKRKEKRKKMREELKNEKKKRRKEGRKQKVSGIFTVGKKKRRVEVKALQSKRMLWKFTKLAKKIKKMQQKKVEEEKRKEEMKQRVSENFTAGRKEKGYTGMGLLSSLRERRYWLLALMVAWGLTRNLAEATTDPGGRPGDGEGEVLKAMVGTVVIVATTVATTVAARVKKRGRAEVGEEGWGVKKPKNGNIKVKENESDEMEIDNPSDAKPGGKEGQVEVEIVNGEGMEAARAESAATTLMRAATVREAA